MTIIITLGVDTRGWSFRRAKREFERQYCEVVLAETKGNCTKAAKLAGKDRKDFYDLMRRCKVKPGRFRRG